MPKVEEVDLEIPDSDIRNDTYKSSGNGDKVLIQLIQPLESLIYQPISIVTSQDGKSQFKNKEKALSV